MRALSRNRKDRYATAAEMREDLLAAIAKLGLEGDPHEALASKLARLFGDRIESKRHLLDRVRSGGDLGELLRAEVDEQVDVPIVSHATPTPVRPPTPKTNRRVIAAVFALAIVAGIGVGAWLRERRHPVAAKVIDAGPTLAVQVQELPPAPPPPPAPQYIVITVETDPTGAKLVVDGEDRGTTPVDLRLPKTDSAVHLVLSQPGFESRAQDVVPDRDQRLYFSLKARRGTVRKTPKRPPPPGFHRFD